VGRALKALAEHCHEVTVLGSLGGEGGNLLGAEPVAGADGGVAAHHAQRPVEQCLATSAIP
jgi:hypothetical protein